MNPQRTSSLPQQKDEELSLSSLQLEEEEVLDPEQLAERRQLFFMLLRTYLAIEDKQLMLTRTLHLLNTQGYYLDAIEVLSIIPDDWPLERLDNFLIHSLRRSLHDYREGQVVLGMSRGENLMVASELYDIFQRVGPTKVDSTTICTHCHYSIGDAIDSIVCDQDNQIFHLNCARKRNIWHLDNDVSRDEQATKPKANGTQRYENTNIV
ncbi:vacuolar sorting protein 39 domain 2-domain-containing protein [Halteromyces radiatus]|uniref:vacuolar sorting protein 39 domain 2-domain-containing protein n=1 Tax=Halteromyces radiatus TaxID=101107 RepID=UPI00221EDD08|nr:vacuolar sorting protein 39 domain 2-domain-containing protein [Halteromyces radiatus]KAI8093372.1 vacuolar sorting protein 39 domain 2-domain-containing protein [Halteromyces radiatus]